MAKGKAGGAKGGGAGTTRPEQKLPAEILERAGRAAEKRPWHRSTVFVSFVSLVGALLIMTLSQIIAEHSWLLRMGGGRDLFGGIGGGLEGGSVGVLPDFGAEVLGPDAEKATYDAADAFALGNAELVAGRLEPAKQQYAVAVQLAPQHSFAWANLGNVQRDLGEWPVAVASHRRAVSLLPTRARHWYNLGLSLHGSRESLPEAVGAFEAAVRLNDALASAHFSLGTALAEMGSRDEAKGCYLKASSLEPASGVGHAARCSLCLQLSLSEGPAAQATCLKELLADAPNHERAIVSLAQTLQALADAGPVSAKKRGGGGTEGLC